MMKKHYILALATCALVNLCSAAVDTEKLEEAIEQSELSRVKSLFKKMEREEMAPVARKKLFGNLYDTAVEITERRSSTMSLFGDWRDMAKTGVGCVSALGSCWVLYCSFRKDQFTNSWKCSSKPAAVIGTAALSLSGYLLYKGITCSAQKGGVAQAKLVEKFIKGRLNNDDEAEPTK